MIRGSDARLRNPNKVIIVILKKVWIENMSNFISCSLHMKGINKCVMITFPKEKS